MLTFLLAPWIPDKAQNHSGVLHRQTVCRKQFSVLYICEREDMKMGFDLWPSVLITYRGYRGYCPNLKRSRLDVIWCRYHPFSLYCVQVITSLPTSNLDSNWDLKSGACFFFLKSMLAEDKIILRFMSQKWDVIIYECHTVIWCTKMH